MKKSLQSLVAVALASSLLLGCTPGCTTTTTSTVTTGTNGLPVTNTTTAKVFDLAAATNTINLAVPPLVGLAVAKEPAVVPYLRDFVTAVKLLNNGSVTPGDLTNAFATAGLSKLTNSEVNIAASTVIALYSQYYGQVVAQKLNTVQYMVPILQALANSISVALPPVPSASIQPYIPKYASVGTPTLFTVAAYYEADGRVSFIIPDDLSDLTLHAISYGNYRFDTQKGYDFTHGPDLNKGHWVSVSPGVSVFEHSE